MSVDLSVVISLFFSLKYSCRMKNLVHYNNLFKVMIMKLLSERAEKVSSRSRGGVWGKGVLLLTFSRPHLTPTVEVCTCRDRRLQEILVTMEKLKSQSNSPFHLSIFWYIEENIEDQSGEFTWQSLIHQGFQTPHRNEKLHILYQFQFQWVHEFSISSCFVSWIIPIEFSFWHISPSGLEI